MKRKRRHRGALKKEKKIKLADDPLTQPALLNSEDDASLDQADDNPLTSQNHPEPTVKRPEDLSAIPNMATEMPTDNSIGKTGQSRVKVKLKSSMALEPHRSSSDAQTSNVTEKKNPQVISDIHEKAKEEEITLSDGEPSDMHAANIENLPRKPASIKIKASRGISSLSESMQNRNTGNSSMSAQMPNCKSLVIAEGARISSSSGPTTLRQREAKFSHNDPHYNEKELKAALVLIKKVMKMDAAGPFNVPVDPVALGIPDYFDVINTPMDFGTICNNLEHGQKYMNSEDVYKDVQYIWNNCYKYNNKGDYVVDLMKRVKKNFDKHWLVAGLYSDTAGVFGSTPTEDVVRSGQEKSYSKSKSKHKGRRIDLHKSDCLCAVCVVRRRRKEREEKFPVIETQVNGANSGEEMKSEENSPPGISCSEDAVSSMEHSAENFADEDIEEADNKIKLEMTGRFDAVQLEQELVDPRMEHRCHESGSDNQPSESLPYDSVTELSHEQFCQHSPQATKVSELAADRILHSKKEVDGSVYQESAEKQGESSNDDQLSKLQDYPPVQEENYLIKLICRSLFPKDPKSLWNGPDSLNRHKTSLRDNPIHVAVATFLKPKD